MHHKGESVDFFLMYGKVKEMEQKTTETADWRTSIGAQYNRFKDAPWFLNPREDTQVLIGGAGGIGSYLAFGLARIGVVPLIYDFDKIERHNIGGQMYANKDIGRLKVDALSKMLIEYSGVYSSTFPEAYTTDNGMTCKYTFSAFDNIKARKEMFAKWWNVYKNSIDAIYIDGRLTFEQLQIFCIKGGDSEKAELYMKEHLPDDTTIEDAPCTMRQTSHTAMMIASHMIAFFTNHLTNVVEQQQVRPVPFFWEFLSPLNYVTQINT